MAEFALLQAAVPRGLRGWLLRRGLGRFQPPSVAVMDELSTRLAFPALESVVVRHLVLPEPTQDFSLDTSVPPGPPLDIVPPLVETTWDGEEAWSPESITTENRFVALGRVSVDGTIYIKDIAASHQPHSGVPLADGDRRPKIITLAQRRSSPQAPQGLNVFELLLPVLLPPKEKELEGLELPSPLFKFQYGGVAFLAERESALLGDDMGLGKTVQAIVALRLLVRTGRIRGGLIICNKSIMAQWKRQLQDWAPDLAWYAVEGMREKRRLFWEAFTGRSGMCCHALLATYETVRQDRDLLAGKSFDLVILDEVQRIKNQDIGISQAIRSLNARRRWGLSGTPLENRIEDLHSIFGFLRPGLLKDSDTSPATVRAKIKPYFLRRRKEDVLKGLPPKLLQDQWLELTEAQSETYRKAEQEGIVHLQSGESVTVQHVLALITRLKQICNFDPLTGESAKADFLVSHLEEVCKRGDKAVVFSQYVETLKKLSERLVKYCPLLYAGALGDRQREEIIRAFKSNPRHQVLLLSVLAGGVGLDLPEANFVFHFDLWWNPAIQRQAEDRAHRIGQTKTVFVRRLLTVNTIEERIDKILQRKALLFNETLEGLADVDLRQSLTEEELFGLFGLKPPRRVQQERARSAGQ